MASKSSVAPSAVISTARSCLETTSTFGPEAMDKTMFGAFCATKTNTKTTNPPTQ